MTRRTILFVSPYAAIPPGYGGPVRVHNLRRQLAERHRVVAFAQQAQRRRLGWSLSPVVLRESAEYLEYSTRLPWNVLLYGVTSDLLNCPPVWQSGALERAAPRWLDDRLDDADLVHVEGPWQFGWVHARIGGRKPLVLGTQNVEADLYEALRIRGPAWLQRRIRRAIARQEEYAIAHADLIVAVTEDDRQRFRERHAVAEDRIVLVTNGVDCHRFAPVPAEVRRRRKEERGLGGRRVVVFVGSLHSPNITAAERILEWAAAWPDPDVTFVVVGAVGRALRPGAHPQVVLAGQVPDTRAYLEAADLALNPMAEGGGSNLKQLEYMAQGLPTVVTPVGARGVPLEDGVHAARVALDEFPARIRALLADEAMRDGMGRAARRLAQERFDWEVVAGSLASAYERLWATFSPSRIQTELTNRR